MARSSSGSPTNTMPGRRNQTLVSRNSPPKYREAITEDITEPLLGSDNGKAKRFFQSKVKPCLHKYRFWLISVSIIIGAALSYCGTVSYLFFLRERTIQYEPWDVQQRQAMWDGEILEPLYKADLYDKRQAKTHKFELVVSHCDHTLGWIWGDFARGTLFEKVTIYSKCGHAVKGIPPAQASTTTIINLPNVGRCDHTYAHWLAENANSYNATNDDDTIMLFLKDNPNYYRAEWGTQRILEDMILIADKYGFACAEFRWWIWELDPVCLHYCCTPVRLSPFHDRAKMNQYEMHRYKRLKRDKLDGFNAPPEHNNLGKWFNDMLSAEEKREGSAAHQSVTQVCYGGNFAFQKNMMNNHDQAVYRKMEKSLSRGNNIEEGHYAERSWASLLSKPLDEEHIDTLLSMNQTYNKFWGVKWPYWGILVRW